MIKIAFSIANFSFWLPICTLKRCFNAYQSALLDSRDSSRLPPIRCAHTTYQSGILGQGGNRVSQEKMVHNAEKFHYCVYETEDFTLCLLNVYV